MNRSKILELIGRTKPLFAADLAAHETEIADRISQSKFLVIGGAGSIGGAVVEEIFKRNPQSLHVVDISENNLAELVRTLRSSLGYISGDFRTFCLDVMSREFDAFAAANNQYDYVLNFSALKHVRSEKDPFTLMRMIRTNIFLTKKSLEFAAACGAKKYFCVSTDKASNPVIPAQIRAGSCLQRQICQRRVLRWQPAAQLSKSTGQTPAPGSTQ